jgi:hypothetical protein
MMMMMMMMLLCISCFLLLNPAESFVTVRHDGLASSAASAASSSLQQRRMGGYYNEPGDTIDQSKTHMIFGVRCVEDIIFCSRNTSVTNLRPAPLVVEAADDGDKDKDKDDDDEKKEKKEKEEETDDTDSASQQRLVAYLLTPDEGDDVYSKPVLKDKRLVQIGTGATALACAQYGGCSSVVVVDDDEVRLKIYQHAYETLNNNNNNDDDNNNEKKAPGGTTACPLETMFLEPKDALPRADVIILSTQNEEWIQSALDSNRTRTVLFEGGY